MRKTAGITEFTGALTPIATGRGRVLRTARIVARIRSVVVWPLCRSRGCTHRRCSFDVGTVGPLHWAYSAQQFTIFC